MSKPVRIDLLGSPVDAVSLSDAVDLVRDAVTANDRLRIAVINVDMVMKARRDPAFARLLWDSDLAIADGVPIVWTASLLGTPICGRVSGTDLVWNCARVSAETGAPVAMIGAMPGVSDRAADVMRARFPDANLHALPTPFPLTPVASKALADEIKSRGARIVLAALGAPRQEQWIRSYLATCDANVGIGIGSAFDIISGAQPRAPHWMREYGLEWLHRLILDPKRLSRRYLVEDSPFVWIALRNAVQRRIPINKIGA